MLNKYPSLYYVSNEYLKDLHDNIDYRVSIKYTTRPFIGILTIIENQKYLIPLTSEITQKRIMEGKKKRNSFFTIFIKDENGNEIANALLNNMIPVNDDVIEAVPICDIESSTYISKEIRYIRKHWNNIQIKAKKVYYGRYNKKSKQYSFLKKMCCNYKKMELFCESYSSQ